MRVYRIIEFQQEFGPFDGNHICQFIAEGRCEADTTVRVEGTGMLIRLRDLPEFAEALKLGRGVAGGVAPLPRGIETGSVETRCACGQVFQASPDRVGGLIKCPQCLRILTVGTGAPASNSQSQQASASARSQTQGRPSPVVVLICAALVLATLVYELVSLSAMRRLFEVEQAETRRQLEAALAQRKQADEATVAAGEKAFQERLHDPAYLSGALARKSHEEEWNRRLYHDPRLAKTPMESNLLRMERIGHDQEVMPEAALEEVARLASPQGSRVVVSNDGGKFVVRVAFRMSVLSAEERGAVTKHHTTDAMRREIESLSARVMRDLFDCCGSRGIELISVSCNHAVRQAPLIPRNATPQERAELDARAPVVMSNLYRASLGNAQSRTVANWRVMRGRRLNELMTVEYDGVDNVVITSGFTPPEDQHDPGGQLEF